MSVIERLAHWGDDLNACDKDERTPLHLSVLEGYMEAVDLLLSSGARPDTSDDQGWQPLHFAA
ncbi:ankyrin repeat domain-containing protein [Candidatus Bathyarchaeota archaeon]|nr:ankyrin repeat domain-containing protein [Candidatus Bathyarchaeota archaeon]